MIDEIVETAEAGGTAFLRKVLVDKRPLRKLREDDSKLAAARIDRAILTIAVASTTKRVRRLEAPFAAAIACAIDLLFEERRKKEYTLSSN
ncbi:hypothetical protein NLM27_26215 [Bradyrhizobium sp. CCGB12]|uniref:hypothetical protein n=1 Tax=Bradyrhizobium sp. CCGB12 TaxID=2949632 RepID=UPI0020B32BEF|nr:hypothetical protein [Bradyrhizobium sp. CCGB12]MCP3392256.1 hypothetical protein [Bradyrhizobium sp. CCGB12]